MQTFANTHTHAGVQCLHFLSVCDLDIQMRRILLNLVCGPCFPVASLKLHTQRVSLRPIYQNPFDKSAPQKLYLLNSHRSKVQLQYMLYK